MYDIAAWSAVQNYAQMGILRFIYQNLLVVVRKKLGQNSQA